MAAALWGCRFVLAAVFAAAGVAKLADLAGSRRAIAEFGVPRPIAAPLGWLLPGAELGVAAALLFDRTTLGGGIGALFLLVVFAGAMAANLARGRAPDCHCFGQVHSAPASWMSVGRNLALALAAVAILVAGSGPELVWPVGLAALVSVVSVAAVLVLASRRRALVAEPLEESPGLPVGSAAPQFELPALDGSTVSLESLMERGRPVLLVFSDHVCGPCQALAAKVASWQREHAAEVTIAILERNLDGARGPDQHGRDTVLPVEGDRIPSAYRAVGTPTAVLVSADGQIASGVAPGIPAIEARLATVAPSLEREVPQHESLSALCGKFVRRELIARAAAGWAALAAVAAIPGWAQPAFARRYCANCNKECGPDCINGAVCGNDDRCHCRDGKDTLCKYDTTRPQYHCADIRNDPENCGRHCGELKFCEKYQICINGKCVGERGPCSCGGAPPDRKKGEVCCGGQCVKPRSDSDNCGTCGNDCAEKGLLNSHCCGGRCVSAATRRHCGSCGNQCADDELCVQTVVRGGPARYECKKRNRCPAGTRGPCSGGCVDETLARRRNLGCCGGQWYEQDVAQKHCGECGRKCGTVNKNEICCGGECINSDISEDNCGCCGNDCGPDCFCNGGGRCVPNGIEPVKCPNCR